MDKIKVCGITKAIRVCKKCGITFFIKPYEVTRGKGIYCSKSCKSKCNFFSKESRKKISKSKIGENNSRWIGGIIKRNNRILVYLPKSKMKMYGQYVYNSRKVMSEHLGRKLLSSEIVHHIDGNSLNDSIDNLKIMSSEEHGRLHNLGKKRKVIV
jgi:hypothetical protein